MATAYISDTRFAKHTLQGHVEHAGRLTAIQEALDRNGVTKRMVSLTPTPVEDGLLRAVHTEDYLKLLAWTETQRGVQLGPDTYVLPESFGVAKLSAGAAVRAVEAVLGGEVNNVLVAARPPGHHALPDMAMGFCLLGNISLAAHHAKKKYGLKRILIVDYDVHHGNGTQDIFYADPEVLFLSTHQHPWYPGTGMLNDTGTGAGTGYTVNVPIQAGVGDDGFARIYEQIVWPVAQRYKPELMLVSAGFDAHWDDPLGGLELSLKGYDHLTRQLMAMAAELCGGKIVFVLEGGYNLEALSHGILNVASALLVDSQVRDPLGPGTSPEPSITKLIEDVRRIHKL